MKKRLLRITNVLLLPVLFLLLMAVSMGVRAEDTTSGSSATATISIDKLDYAPGDFVQITGKGWIGDDVVYLQVFNETYPAYNGTGHYMYWKVYPDPITGDFSSTWDVTEDELNTSLVLTADGKNSGFKYQVFFTDANAWTLTPANSNSCLGSTLDFTIKVTGTTALQSFYIPFPSGFEISNPSIVSITSNKSWSISSTSASICLTANSPTNSSKLNTNETIIFRVNVSSSSTSGSYNIVNSRGDNGGNACSGTGAFPIPTPSVALNALPIGSASPQTICSGTATSIALSSSITGTTFAWTAAQLSGATITGFVNGSGTTIAQTLTNTGNTDAGVVRYTVIPTSPAPANCSGAPFTVDVTVNSTPAITTQPTAQAVTYGADATFTAAASGTPAPTYQWQVNTGSGFTNIPSATSATLTIAKPTVAMSGYQYRCVATNTCGTETSTAATLTVSKKDITGNFTANNKVYDGGVTASILTRTLNGVISGDVVSLTGGTATFSDKNVNTGKTVTFNMTGASLSGTDAGNYSLTNVGTAHADITARSLTLNNFVADSKTYDGTTDVLSGAGFDDNRVAGDNLTFSYNKAFVDKNVGPAKVVNFTSIAISGGTDQNNYSLATLTGTAHADITARSLTITATGVSKVYDGNTTATVNLSDNRISGDIFTDAYTSASFVDPNVANGITINVSGISINGTDANNYSLLNTTAVTKANITALSVATSFSVSSNLVQYSDLLTFTATITGGAPLVSGGPQAASTVTFKVGTQTMGTATLTISGNDLVATLTAPLLETVAGQMSPGTKTISAVFNSLNSNFTVSPNPATTNITITQEDADLSYTGALFQATPNSTATTANVILSAVIQDKSDNNRGDIRNACVSFIVDGTVVVSGLQPKLINPADLTTGIVTYNYTASVGSTGYQSYTVETRVDCYYNRYFSEDKAVLTVYQPVGDFITGGGYIINPSTTAGTLAGTPGLKTNFGFNVKYNKTGKSLQGNMNFIFRRSVSGVVRTYQIKSNSMTSLGVNIANPAAQTAVFVSKANLTDITNPLSPQSLGGNLSMQVNMTDRGEPGTTDGIAISLYDGSTLMFSSMWSGTKTDEKVIDGGNLVVHSGFSLKDAEILSTEPVSEVASVKAYPNPFSDRLFVEFNSATDCNATLEIYNITGAKLATLFNAPIEAGVMYKVDYIPNSMTSQVVLYHLTMDGKTQVGKLIYHEKK